MLPVGADILDASERAETETSEVDTSHLSVQGAVFVTDQPAEVVNAPSVDHLTLAEVGAQLGQAPQDVVVDEIDTDFDLAEVGAILGSLDDIGNEIVESTSAPNVASVDFDLAEPGAEMNQRPAEPEPAAPDTSHLKIDQ